jgi:outer membrane receptor protein involved in Fe transport
VGGFVVPNPNLEPETSRQLDLGTRWHGGPLRASLNYFLNELRNLITSGPGSFMGQTEVAGEPVSQNLNVDQARIQGIEATAEFSLDALGSRWTPLATAAWQRGTNRTTKEPLPLIAPFIAHVGLRWVPRGSRAWTEWRTSVVKGGGRVPMGAAPLSGYTIHALRWGYELVREERGLGALLPKGLSSLNFNFALGNATNHLYQGLFENVPEPGREIRFGLDLNLDSNAR